MRFLISRLSSLGDVVCTLPTVVALKHAYPDASISWVVAKPFADLVRGCWAIDEVIEAKKSINKADWPELKEPFDAAFDLQGLFKSAWPVHLAKSKVKLGYHWQREGSALFSRRVLPDPSSFHIVDQYVDVVRAYGAETDRADFGLSPSATDLANVKERLKAESVERFVVMNPGAGWESKRWPSAFFGEVANWLANHGIATILIGGATDADKATAEEVISASNPNTKNPNTQNPDTQNPKPNTKHPKPNTQNPTPNTQNLTPNTQNLTPNTQHPTPNPPLAWTGTTTVGELMALLSLAQAHLGGDTGSTHIAAALGVPCVGLYSITNPRRSCPYGQIENCLYDPGSLKNITPETVEERLEEVLPRPS